MSEFLASASTVSPTGLTRGAHPILLRFLGLAVLAWMAAPAQAQPASELSESRLIRVLHSQRSEDPAAVITALAIHPNGDWLAAAGDDHVVRLWDLQRGQLLSEQAGHADWVRSAAFSERGDELFTAAADGKVLAWYPARRSPPKTVFARDAALLSLALTQGGQLAVLAGFEGPLQMVGTKEPRTLRRISCACEHIRTVAISPDGHTMACGSRDGRVFIWSLETGELLHTIAAHARRINCMTFDPEEPWLFTAADDRKICLWDCKNGTQEACVSTGRSKVLSLAALGQGGLAAGGTDNVIQVWDLPSGKRLATLAGHSGSVATLASRGDLLVSGSYDTTIRVWTLSGLVGTAQASRSASVRH